MTMNVAVCTNFGWFLLSWCSAMCQIFCCSIIQGVSFNYREMWGLQSRSRTSRSRSRSRLLWESLGLVSKFEPGLGHGLGGYGLENITATSIPKTFWVKIWSKKCWRHLIKYKQIFMSNDKFLYQMIIFYVKWRFLEIGVFGLLIIFWKCHSWTERIQVEQ